MLSRRHLRIKAMQALYSFFQSSSGDIPLAEKNLFKSIDKIYELYLQFLLLIPELALYAERLHNQEKNFPKKEDIALPNFFENPFVVRICTDQYLKDEVKKRLISWKSDEATVKKIFLAIKKSPDFKAFILSGPKTFEEGKVLLCKLFKDILEPSPDLASFIEEKNVFWMNSGPWMVSVVIKTLETLNKSDAVSFLIPVYKDESDKEFISTLFLRTIENNEEYEKEISARTTNWEVERIALMDIIVMKMALTELIHFPLIPVKVSINEYLEIAREYSTPGSNSFINGVIDNLANAYKASGKIVKRGAGLVG